jgi:hypothetical protein
MSEQHITVTTSASQWQTERCLGNVRWVQRSMMQAGDYVLQQLFEITEYKGGKPIAARMEWRSVPHEDGP